VDSFCESSDSSRIVCMNFDSKSFIRIWNPNPELYKGSLGFNLWILSFHKILFESDRKSLRLWKILIYFHKSNESSRIFSTPRFMTTNPYKSGFASPILTKRFD
jgi:hypothetical protein